MKQEKQRYFKILTITMALYGVTVLAFVWLNNGPLAHVNLRAGLAILPILPMIIIFPAMIRFLNNAD